MQAPPKLNWPSSAVFHRSDESTIVRTEFCSTLIAPPPDVPTAVSRTELLANTQPVTAAEHWS